MSLHKTLTEALKSRNENLFIESMQKNIEIGELNGPKEKAAQKLKFLLDNFPNDEDKEDTLLKSLLRLGESSLGNDFLQRHLLMALSFMSLQQPTCVPINALNLLQLYCKKGLLNYAKHIISKYSISWTSVSSELGNAVIALVTGAIMDNTASDNEIQFFIKKIMEQGMQLGEYESVQFSLRLVRRQRKMVNFVRSLLNPTKPAAKEEFVESCLAEGMEDVATDVVGFYRLDCFSDLLQKYDQRRLASIVRSELYGLVFPVARRDSSYRDMFLEALRTAGRLIILDECRCLWNLSPLSVGLDATELAALEASRAEEFLSLDLPCENCLLIDSFGLRAGQTLLTQIFHEAPLCGIDVEFNNQAPSTLQVATDTHVVVFDLLSICSDTRNYHQNASIMAIVLAPFLGDGGERRLVLGFDLSGDLKMLGKAFPTHPAFSPKALSAIRTLDLQAKFPRQMGEVAVKAAAATEQASLDANCAHERTPPLQGGTGRGNGAGKRKGGRGNGEPGGSAPPTLTPGTPNDAPATEAAVGADVAAAVKVGASSEEDGSAEIPAAKPIGSTKISLSNLSLTVLGKPLNKELRMMDWAARPLTKRMIDYAALDANVLVRIFRATPSLQDTVAPPPAFPARDP